MEMGPRISKQHDPFITTMDIQANEEREGMQAMQRREGRVADGERRRTCGWREGKHVRIERGETRADGERGRTSMSDAKDTTINNKCCCCCCRQQYT